jgi:EAL domain-containing protein (putative c-di-GMP-specific phosphodiesterase class I)/CRP-like cAMP-binding protein
VAIRLSNFRRTFSPASTLFREGEGADCAYIIEKGRVEISALRNGRQVRLAILGENELVGEMAVVDDQVRSATVTALEETRVVVIEREQVKRAMDRADPLVRLFLRVILERQRSTHRRMLRYRLGDSGTVPVMPRRDIDYQTTRKQAIDRLKLEQQLSAALEAGAFELFFQPIIALADGRTAGFEALIRWRKDESLVLPQDFIGLAEATGLIAEMGLWALGEGCRTLTKLQEAASDQRGDSPPLYMSINVSPRQLSDPQLTDTLRHIVEGAGIDPRQLRLEITETALMEEPDLAAEILGNLHELGVRIMIDDFGTGYSSLSYLNRFPIDTLKIDRSFIHTMLEQQVSERIVRSVTGLARDLELELVAEGIETRGQFERLRELGCEYGQGFGISEPVTAAEAMERLSRGGGWGFPEEREADPQRPRT